LTGRGSSAEWHTGTRTSTSAILRALHPAVTRVEMQPDDAEARAISTNDDVVVTSRRGRIAARALVTSTVAPGQVLVPMHDAATNRLTFPTFDPFSRQPGYKYAAVGRSFGATPQIPHEQHTQLQPRWTHQKHCA
jgi:assimilatory nitrate reductase catalytic subunit